MTATPDTGELPVVTPSPEQESPLIPSPTEPPAWYVSLVPPKDSLPLDFDPLAGSTDQLTSQSVVPAPRPAVTEPPVTAPDVTGPDVTAPAIVAPTAPALVAQTALPAIDPTPSRWSLDRLRATWCQGLPTPHTVLLAAVVVAPGPALDVARDGSFGLPSTVLFLIIAVSTPLVLRPRSLAVGVVLPPLAFVGAAAAIAWRSGLNSGSREIGLDVGTTMALQAPLLFLGTAAALAVVLARVVVRLVRR